MLIEHRYAPYPEWFGTAFSRLQNWQGVRLVSWRLAGSWLNCRLRGAYLDALRAAIEDDDLRRLPEFGAADQFLSSNFVLAVPAYSSAATTALLHTSGREAG
ncbi:hypothetical protein [Sinorhizobium sp. 8-89]|uniref:hypothetical protein n=1 Tax=Sinorhizobium sp. 8-89 TaxID=3049089 RepID=UPI0024C2A13C|nr:hypothetical protein [Sinorhizobium sp. 8-89]